MKKNTKILLLAIIAVLILLISGFFLFIYLNRQESVFSPQTELDMEDKDEIIEEEIVEESEEVIYEELTLDITISENLEQAIDQFDSSEKLVGFLNQSFVFELKQGDIALEPREFFENKKGNELDFAVFAAHVLDFHKYETGIIRYEFTANNQESVNTIVIFRDTDLPKYIFFSQGKTFLTHHGWSFNELFQAEEKRLSIDISRFVIFYPNVFDLTPKEWIER